MALFLCWEVFKVKFYTNTFWMSVVNCAFIQIVGKIVCHGVPATIFKVNQTNLSAVFKQSQNVILLYIIVPEDDLLITRHHFCKMCLVTIKQQCSIYRVNCLEKLWMRDTIVLKKFAAHRWESFFKFRSPLINRFVDCQV